MELVYLEEAMKHQYKAHGKLNVLVQVEHTLIQSLGEWMVINLHYYLEEATGEPVSNL